MSKSNLKSVVLAAAMLWSAVSTSALSSLTEREFSFSGVQGQEFSQHLKAQVSASTNIQCALRCERTDGCLSYTFSKGDKRCRLHAIMIAADMTFTAVPGAKLFLRAKPDWLEKGCTSSADCPEVDTACVAGRCVCSEGFFLIYPAYQCKDTWLYSPCSSDANCLVVNAKCLDSQCVCAPGYYFSDSTGQCIDSCATLGTSVIRYNNTDFSQPAALGDLTYALILGVIDESYCQSLCKALISCRVVVIDNTPALLYPSGKCYYRTSDPLDYISSWDRTSDKTSYQRTCA